MALQWSNPTQNVGSTQPNSLAQQFPFFQISAKDARRGAVKVEARAPSGRLHEMSVVDNNGVYTANFTPTEVGEWQVAIKYEGQHIQGSPFNVRVYDAAQVKVYGLQGGAVGKTFSFTVDTTGAGEGELTVNIVHNGRIVPANISHDPSYPGRFTVNFTPDGSGIYTIKVFFSGIQVTGSPYTLEIVDSSQVTASGKGLSSVEINRKAEFIVNTGHPTNSGDLLVEVTGPRGNKIPSTIRNIDAATFAVEYVPSDVGEYIIDVSFYGRPIKGSPFKAQAFDFSRINVSNLRETGLVGRAVEFDIDASQGGSGNLEIMVNDGTIPCSVQNRGNRQFHASFVPKEAKSHFIQMRFNGRDVPGSPWRVDVLSAANVSASGNGLQLVPVNTPTKFEVRTGNFGYNGEIQVNIIAPSRRQVPSSITNIGGGNFSVEYVPNEVGNYQVEVMYEGMAIPGSPFTSKAYDASSIVVSSIPNGTIGKAVEFTIDVTQAGEGQLEIMVNRGAVPNSVRMLRKGVFLVSFVPRDTRPHTVDVKFNGQLLPYSPINVPILDSSRITVQGDGLRQVAVNRQSVFRVNTQSAGDADLAVRVTSPNGELVPAKILQQPDGDYKVEYSSRYTGRHTVEILYAGQAIMGSPFYVEIYDPNKIRVEGTRSGIVGQKMEFDIINNEAGRAELGMTITSPSGRSVPFDVKPGQLGDHVVYIPTEPGPHQIFLTYGGLEVPGTPITQSIMDAGSAAAFGDGLKFAHQDQSAEFYVDTQGRQGNLDVQVDGPNSIAKVNIKPEMNGKYLVTYIPVEVGLYNVNIRWNGRPIDGSPYRPRVVDARRVAPVGGWEAILDQQEKMHLKVNQRNRIEFDTRLAGPGEMRAEVKGPEGLVPVDVDGGNGTFGVNFIPRTAGDYFVKVYWGEMALSRCPIYAVAESEAPVVPVVPAAPAVPVAVPSHDKVILTGHGLVEARVNQEAEFVIDGSEAGPGSPDVRLTGVKDHIDVRVIPLGGNKYKAVYSPTSAGAYLLSIMWSDRQVRGSPFKVNVLASSDASKVSVSGDGIRGGVYGKEIKAVIDTRRAGPGELTAHCMGPQKVAYCELYDHRDGTFTLNIKPQESGKHILQVKYGGEHVPGSPFALRVAGAPDASKVRVSGPGIEHGILATYQSRFIVETRGAGAGQLTVRIRGPKGAFRVEMSRESQKDRTILCRYDPTEVGTYFTSVKWSGEHVPGSPFHVQIFDTNEELERFIHQNPGRRMNAQIAGPDRRWSEDL